MKSKGRKKLRKGENLLFTRVLAVTGSLWDATVASVCVILEESGTDPTRNTDVIPWFRTTPNMMIPSKRMGDVQSLLSRSL